MTTVTYVCIYKLIPLDFFIHKINRLYPLSLITFIIDYENSFVFYNTCNIIFLYYQSTNSII